SSRSPSSGRKQMRITGCLFRCEDVVVLRIIRTRQSHRASVSVARSCPTAGSRRHGASPSAPRGDRAGSGAGAAVAAARPLVGRAQAGSDTRARVGPDSECRGAWPCLPGAIWPDRAAVGPPDAPLLGLGPTGRLAHLSACGKPWFLWPTFTTEQM